jgi:hypothetical protein
LQIRDGRSRLVVAAQATRPALRHQGFKEAFDKLTRFAAEQGDRRGRETRR